MSEDYNGWVGKGNKASAYATWRVKLELVDADYLYEGYAEAPDAHDLADRIEEDCKDYVCASVDDEGAEKLATQYALAFLDNVSWDEIAEHILSDWPEEDEAS
jgi:hypothetical protein